MSIRNGTKRAFAEALKRVLNTKEMGSVRVQDLCRLCGTERPTFYYHFRDKYDLVTWIYEQDVRRTVQQHGRYNAAQLEMLLELMQQEQVFYRKAFADSAQNALLPYIQQMILSMTRSAVKDRRSGEDLTQEEQFTINFLAYSWCRCLVDWIEGKYTLSAGEYAQLMYRQLSYLGLREIPAMELPEEQSE